MTKPNTQHKITLWDVIWTIHYPFIIVLISDIIWYLITGKIATEFYMGAFMVGFLVFLVNLTLIVSDKRFEEAGE